MDGPHFGTVSFRSVSGSPCVSRQLPNLQQFFYLDVAHQRPVGEAGVVTELRSTSLFCITARVARMAIGKGAAAQEGILAQTRVEKHGFGATRPLSLRSSPPLSRRCDTALAAVGL